MSSVALTWMNHICTDYWSVFSLSMHSVVCALNVYYLFDCRSGYVVLQREEQEHHTWLDGPVDGGPPGSAVLDRVHRLRQQARGQAGNRRWWSQVRVNHLCKLGSIKGVALGEVLLQTFHSQLGTVYLCLSFYCGFLKGLEINISQPFCLFGNIFYDFCKLKSCGVQFC